MKLSHITRSVESGLSIMNDQDQVIDTVLLKRL